MNAHNHPARHQTAIVIWANQLSLEYHSALQADPKAPVIMIESRTISRRFKYHKQKLAFVFTAMREYADALRTSGRTVYYAALDEAEPDWFEELAKICHQKQITNLLMMRASDRPPQLKLESWCKQQGISLETTPNTLFLTSHSQFNEWAEDHRKRLHLEQFYRWQRQRLNILMTEGGKPEGGKWNYDAENRQPLSKDYKPPQINFPQPSAHRAAVIKLIAKHFADHPGSLDTNWLPTSRPQALAWLQDFIDNRFQQFGAYEDAMQHGQVFLNHSALSALMNIGILHPLEIVQAALDAQNIPLAGREGFIRQIIGWREFMFGLYHYRDLDWKDSNYFGHSKQLERYWWTLQDEPDGAIPKPPLQDVLQRVHQYGYSHHIERLMIVGNYMLLKQYAPKQVYAWFMTMYVDAYEWVMVPNVIGMSQFADGGIEHGGFATKPYISGSNYVQKMGKWWPSSAAAKDSDWAELYWKFLEIHEDKLRSNFRIAPLYRNVDRRRNS